MTKETAGTPRTDAGAWIEDCSRKGEQIEVVRTKLARKLEREVVALTAERDALNEKLVEEISAKNFYKEKLEAAEAELDAAKRALAEKDAALQFVRDDLGFAEWGNDQHGAELLRAIIGRNVPALTRALAAKSTEQPMNCKDAGPGRGLCDMCAAGRYEKCRYAAKSTEVPK